MKNANRHSIGEATQSKSENTNSHNGIPRDKQQTNNHALTLLKAYKMLSRRECEILEKIGEGKSCRQIADGLFLSKKTVENHITNIGKN